MNFFNRFAKVDFKKPKTIISLVAFSLIGTIVVIATVYFITVFSSKVEMIDMTKMTAAEIQSWATDNKVSDNIIIEEVFDETIEANTVISQSLVVGENINEPVTILISKGPDPQLVVELPDFTTMSLDEAKQWFTDNLFTDINVEQIASDTTDAGEIISLNVVDKASRDQAILISVSVGTDSVGVEIIVPDFKEYSKADIEAWANTNNIEVIYKYVYSDDVEADKIVIQDPIANSKSTTGSEITVTISLGEAVNVTNFIGSSESSITSWAKTNEITLTKKNYYSSKDSGTILGTNPKSGTTISKGSKLTYEVSVGLVKLANYVGKDKSSFSTYIDALNKENNQSAQVVIEYISVNSDTVTKGLISKMTFVNKSYSSSSDTTLSISPQTGVKVYISQGPVIKVTSYSGKTLTEFQKYLSDNSLSLGSKGEKYSTTITKGSIISNDTGDYQTDTSVNYVVSLGAYTPSVSEYQNKTISAAQNVANDYASKGATKYTVVKTDTVDSTSITAGNTVTCSISGTNINCTVSKGSPITMTNQAGTTETAFKTLLTSKGLVAGTKTSTFSDTVTSGTLISSTAGTYYNGDKVNYNVSKGSEITKQQITDLQSMISSEPSDTKTKIKAYLTGLGFTGINDSNLTIVESEVSKGGLITYNPAGVYALDYTGWNIQISNGN